MAGSSRKTSNPATNTHVEEPERAPLEQWAGLQGTVRALEAVSQAVFASFSWRAGQRLAAWLRRLGLRMPVSTAESEMQRLIGELKQIAELPDMDQVPEPDEVVLGRRFRLSRTVPRRFPATPPRRPVHWHLAESTRDRLRAQIQQWQSRPLISVIVPVHNTRPDWLRETVASVRAQFYPHWELCLVDDASTSEATIKALAALESEAGIRVQRREVSGGISRTTNEGLEMAAGDYVAFLDHDDLLEPDALLQIARAIEHTGADLVYTDEDKTDEAGGTRFDPHYKPAWSPDLLLSQNYMSHLSVIRRELVEKVGGLRPAFDGSQDHDLLLRCVEQAHEVVHVPLALYHWRAVEGSTAREFSEKSYPWEAGRRAVQDAAKRRRIGGEVELGDRPGTYRINRKVSGTPRVSILIPFRDQPELLDQCIRSILEKTGYPHYEIIGLDNQSADSVTHELMQRLADADERVRFESYDRPFNFSGINNFGAEQATGEHLLLLNNDTEVITPEWLGAMLAHSQRDDVGAVGAKLLYPDDRIQHAGVMLGIGGVAGHSHKFTPNEANGYFSRPHVTQNISAVTGACLMVERGLYRESGGLDEETLAIAFNDIDFCIRLRERGLLNIYEPAATLYHHESISRGYEDSKEKRDRFAREVIYMQARHSAALAEADPYFSPNLAQHSESFLPR